MLGTGLAMALLMPFDATAAGSSERNEGLRPLLACRSMEGAEARLSCFDRESAKLDEADRRNEITVLDKEDVQETRRSLFGFSTKALSFLGGGDNGDAPPEAQSISARIASVRSLGHDKWQFTLEDGATWRTLEAVTSRQPAAGRQVEIKRAALGSYLGKVDGGRAVRMRRVD
jgi:hypothetical protein